LSKEALVTELVNRKLADHMMAFDLLVQLTRIMTEEEAIRVILELFAMLFGAGRVLYAPVTGETLGTTFALNPEPDDDARMRWWHERLKPGDDFVSVDNGFCIRVAHRQTPLGILGIDPVEFSQHKQDYLNLALNVAPLCGLAISNAQTVSERQRMAAELSKKSEELARSNADLEQFAYVASHDLQAPLRRIIEFGSMLNEECGTMLNDSGRECVGHMQKSAARMQLLIKGLLTYSRVGRSGMALAPVKLSAVFQQVAEDLAPRLNETGGSLEVGEMPEVMADAVQMYQLFQNLCGNALKFIPKGAVPRVAVSWRRIEGGMVEITVKDNGIGFDEKHLEKIFKPFQRLHGEDVYPGSGIGLAVCQKIVQRHGGAITAHSRTGEGAAFVVTLPGCG
jgi:signal transduction histidine kinase